MSFGRGVIIAAIVAGAFTLFKKDIQRIVGALKKPTQAFVADVAKELEKGAERKAEGGSVAGVQRTIGNASATTGEGVTAAGVEERGIASAAAVRQETGASSAKELK